MTSGAFILVRLANSLHRRHVRRYLSGHYVTGWEDQQGVVRRVSASLADHRERAGQRRLVVVGHGISAALWVAATLGQDAVRRTSLRIPDAWEIDLLPLRAADRGDLTSRSPSARPAALTRWHAIGQDGGHDDDHRESGRAPRHDRRGPRHQ